jgi:hypothetical protein
VAAPADVEQILPRRDSLPYFDRSLGHAMVRETELFFDSLVREDRSLLDLLTADHTFVNERSRGTTASQRDGQRVPCA